MAYTNYPNSFNTPTNTILNNQPTTFPSTNTGCPGQQYPTVPNPSQPPSVFPGTEPEYPVILPERPPESITQPIYIPGFLRSLIGALVRVEFLIGNATTERVGYIKEVGADYLLLDAMDFTSSIMCDLVSVKFVTILRGRAGQQVATTYPEF